MPSPDESFDRCSFQYWIDGNGHWISRWHSTNGDLFLLFFVLVPMLWMVYEYAKYIRMHEKAGEVSSSSFSKFHVETTKALRVCICLHVLSWLLPWIVPYYTLLAPAYAFHAWQTRRLSRSDIHTKAGDENAICIEARLVSAYGVRILKDYLKEYSHSIPSPRILVLDDNEQDLVLVSRWLTDYRVDLARSFNGVDKEAKYDIILCDVNMPSEILQPMEVVTWLSNNSSATLLKYSGEADLEGVIVKDDKSLLEAIEKACLPEVETKKYEELKKLLRSLERLRA